MAPFAGSIDTMRFFADFGDDQLAVGHLAAGADQRFAAERPLPSLTASCGALKPRSISSVLSLSCTIPMNQFVRGPSSPLRSDRDR
ncbi:hypothetical protein V1294_007440 [Bradyrhizobium sp. AZCC 1678]|uniref:hypothetical protein n=1 Tax=Bradyrhizobium sp. AZCC 1678 TaxID=3117030 RepID=UPI00305C99AC